MARTSKRIATNPITRNKIKRCRECATYKSCTIAIARITTSPFCLHKLRDDISDEWKYGPLMVYKKIPKE